MATKTGFVYDERVNRHHDPISDLKHIENPNRTRVAHQIITESGILQKTTAVSSRDATDEDLLMVHCESHLAAAKKYSSGNPHPFVVKSEHPTYTCDDTHACARLSTGCVLSLADAVCSGKVQNGFALVRPPGHHAEIEESMGFCYFNNVAIAAKYIQKTYADVSRVAIVDWDVHHGNGVQHAFYDDPSVLYISLHRYDNGKFYPRLDGNFDSIGQGKGQGYNVNIPWNNATMGDVEYRTAFDEIIKPILAQFDPDMVLVCSGFDAATGDPLGQYEVTPAMYGWMVRQLQAFAGGKLLVALEGGYQPHMNGLCAVKVLEALTGGEVIEVATSEPCQSARESIEAVKSAHAQFWKFA